MLQEYLHLPLSLKEQYKRDQLLHFSSSHSVSFAVFFTLILPILNLSANGKNFSLSTLYEAFVKCFILNINVLYLICSQSLLLRGKQHHCVVYPPFKTSYF